MGEVSFGNRSASDSLLEQPAEDEPAAARGPAIEAKSEFLQVGLQVCAANRPLVGAEYPPFEQTGDGVYTRPTRTG